MRSSVHRNKGRNMQTAHRHVLAMLAWWCLHLRSLLTLPWWGQRSPHVGVNIVQLNILPAGEKYAFLVCFVSPLKPPPPHHYTVPPFPLSFSSDTSLPASYRHVGVWTGCVSPAVRVQRTARPCHWPWNSVRSSSRNTPSPRRSSPKPWTACAGQLEDHKFKVALITALPTTEEKACRDSLWGDTWVCQAKNCIIPVEVFRWVTCTCSIWRQYLCTLSQWITFTL